MRQACIANLRQNAAQIAKSGAPKCQDLPLYAVKFVRLQTAILGKNIEPQYARLASIIAAVIAFSKAAFRQIATAENKIEVKSRRATLEYII